MAFLLDQGWIVPSGASQAALVVFEQKPDGTWRFWQDYCWLNAITQQLVEPLQHFVDQLVDKTRGACFFTKLDLVMAYMHFQILVEDQYMTSFHVPLLPVRVARWGSRPARYVIGADALHALIQSLVAVPRCSTRPGGPDPLLALLAPTRPCLDCLCRCTATTWGLLYWAGLCSTGGPKMACSDALSPASASAAPSGTWWPTPGRCWGCSSLRTRWSTPPPTAPARCFSRRPLLRVWPGPFDPWPPDPKSHRLATKLLVHHSFPPWARSCQGLPHCSSLSSLHSVTAISDNLNLKLKVE